jgi:precorrin-6B methylase 1
VIERFGRDRCRVIPGISSVQTAFARLSLDWSDAAIISAHKQDPEPDPSWAQADKIAVLGGRANSLRWVAERLLPVLGDRRVFVCENRVTKKRFGRWSL